MRPPGLSLSLSQKLIAPIVLVFLLLGIALGYMYVVDTSERKLLDATTQQIKLQNQRLYTINALLRSRQRAMMELQFTRKRDHLYLLEDLERKTSALLNELRSSIESERERELIEELFSTREAEQQLRRLFTDALLQNDPESHLAFNRWTVHLRRTGALIADLTLLNSKALDRVLAQTDRARVQAAFVMSTLILASIAVVVFFGIAVNRSVIRPLVDLTRAARSVAGGELAPKLGQLKLGDEIGELASTFKMMTESLAVSSRRVDATISELHQSNEDLRAFAYISSHDLKEPLRMISLYVQLLERDYADSQNDTIKGYLRTISDGAARMKALIEDLLAYSEIGVRKAAFEQVNLNKLLEQIRQDLQVALIEAGTQLYCPSLPVVWGNPSQLRQLLENLVSNAVKFRKPNTPNHIRIEATENEVEWEIRVVDNGIGIREEYWETVFQAFKRLHTRSEFPGTGIGLAICKRIVERHGGRIWLESRPDVGTTFFFKLPKPSSSNSPA